MKEKLKRGILYLSVHNQLVKKIGVGRTLSRKEMFCILGRHFLVPKRLKNAVIEEMVNMDLLEKENGKTLIISKIDIDLEKDANKLYKQIGL